MILPRQVKIRNIAHSSGHQHAGGKKNKKKLKKNKNK